MRIVLLSDLHYQGAASKRVTQENLIDMLVDRIAESPIDVLVFAGDSVWMLRVLRHTLRSV